MLKLSFQMAEAGRKGVMLVLSERNVQLLKRGRPIEISLDDLISDLHPKVTLSIHFTHNMDDTVQQIKDDLGISAIPGEEKRDGGPTDPKPAGS